MKNMKNFVLCRYRDRILGLFAALTLTLAFGAAQAARAQQLTPFVDCVERVDNANYRVYYGYFNTSVNNIEIEFDTPGNFYIPVPDPLNPPQVFTPGVHHRVVAVTVPNAQNETWVLGIEAATARAQTLLPCSDAGSHTRTITYQGSLKDGNQTANGQYDLRFQIFDAATGGAAKSATLAVENIQVTNGVFTAQLDFGILPAMLDGANLFMEIGVRAGTSTGAYTTLTPRQPLTATPYAIRAQSAANADLLGGVNSEGFIRRTGDGSTSQTITGNLTVTGTITGTATNAVNATNVSGGYVQLPLTSGAPPAADCGDQARGRMQIESSNGRLYVCTAAGWKFTVLQ